ncbi:MAG: hypothetical protein AB1589_13325 [Cyanobacteriota bacterium]
MSVKFPKLSPKCFAPTTTLHTDYVIARFSKADTILRSRYTQNMRSHILIQQLLT